MNYICTWLYIEDKSDESYYPQVGGSSSKIHVQNLYYKCVFNFFHSSIKFNKKNNYKHIFFTNNEKLDVIINKLNINTFLKENNIEVINLNLSNKTPIDWYGSWRNQFYIFDILTYIENTFEQEDNFLILDSDCVFTNSAKDIFSDISKYGNIAYNLYFNDNHSENGITPVEMAKLYNKIFNSNEKYISYYGGEFLGATYDSIKKINEKFKTLWHENYKLYNNKQKKLNEEAHFLSVIYKNLGLDNNIANKYIKRMWTAIKYNNIEKNDEEFFIWHLPYEKKTGFNSLYKIISRDYTKYLELSEDEYRKILKNNLGIPRRKKLKVLKDIYNLFKIKIENKIRFC